ncbi:MAG TPA: MoaD/ThiS family protein [Candidatus Elarobacter sp.]|nr:MoaD/ThiS family protein [Candidatus Elarobacter sp.]
MTETSNRAAVVTARVLAFARLRELLGFGERLVTVPSGTTLDGLWSHLAAGTPQLAGLRASTRFARNGGLADGGAAVCDGDEIALLPPVGGG